MKLFICGKGGELCIGKLSEEQEDFVFSNAEDEEIEFDDFWEDNEIMNGAWFDFDDILHTNSVYVDDHLTIKNQRGHKFIAKGKFEIDFEDNDRFEMLDDNKKVILGSFDYALEFSK